MNSSAQTAEIRIQESQEVFDLYLLGDWVIDNQLPNTEFVFEKLADRKNKEIEINTKALGNWDSGLITFLVKLRNYADQEKIEVNFSA
ncbi:MAG: hypothetical protein HKN83_06475, partial [Gammaproteobacteria bacterium]|nr:hypothetical protein [Gammaproteobacteria bacterium]